MSSGADLGFVTSAITKVRETRNEADGFSEILRVRLVEVVDDWQVTALTEKTNSATLHTEAKASRRTMLRKAGLKIVALFLSECFRWISKSVLHKVF
jgi:hypothetical protein